MRQETKSSVSSSSSVSGEAGKENTTNPGIASTHCVSSTRSINTGTPQGTVISPFIFTLYTNDCRSRDDKQLTIKFSDDTAVVDLTDSEAHFESSVRDFSEWCKENYLELNVGKTKEMVVDFRMNRTDVGTLQIDGQAVERVEEYRYLGTVIDHQFKFKTNTQIIHKKCRQRMVMLYQLRTLKVSSRILMQCYQAFVESILTFSFICWFGSLGVSDRKVILRIAKQCGKIIGNSNINLESLYKKRVTMKAFKILRDSSHCMHNIFEMLPSNKRFRMIRCKTNRFQNSFFPAAIKYLNEGNDDRNKH